MVKARLRDERVSEARGESAPGELGPELAGALPIAVTNGQMWKRPDETFRFAMQRGVAQQFRKHYGRQRDDSSGKEFIQEFNICPCIAPEVSDYAIRIRANH